MLGRGMPAAFAAVPLIAALALLVGHKTLCRGFLPENNLRIPVGDVNAQGLSQEQFDAVLDRIEEIYKPVVAARGGRLVVRRLWEDARVNASANQSWGTWYVNMYGGLARHAAVTPDGFALVACHEVGHHVGGFPKMRGWATNEGGADYFATLKCLRKVFPGLEGAGDVDPVAGKACRDSFEGGGDRTLCARGAMAGQSIAALLHILRPGSKPPSFGTPDESVVDRTDDNHPAPQCRLDTMFHGALCIKGHAEELSDKEPGPGACTRAEGFEAGVRPLCWYKPPQQTAPQVAVRERLPDSKSLKLRIESLRRALSGA